MRAFPANIIFETSKCRRTMSLVIIIGVRYIENKCDERKKEEEGGGGGEVDTKKKKQKKKQKNRSDTAQRNFAWWVRISCCVAYIMHSLHNLHTISCLNEEVKNPVNYRTRSINHNEWVYWAVQWRWFARENALCNLSRKKSLEVAASLPGRFLSRRCFTLCITIEVGPRIAKQYKCHHCCSCKNYRGKGMEGGKKSVFPSFFGGSRFREGEKKKKKKKCVLGHLIARAFWLRASKDAFKVGSVKFANSLSPPSVVKKVRTESKSSQGT